MKNPRQQSTPPSSPEAVKPPAIFVNYRRKDCESAAQYLAADLSHAFGDGAVFFDQRSIDPGAQWPDDIRNRLAQAKVVLACIGKQWHRVQDDETGDNRLNDPQDWVRRELEWAADQPIPVIPVLLDGCTELPRAALELRPTLAFVAALQPQVLRAGRERDHGLEQLVAQIVKLGVAKLTVSARRVAPVADLRQTYLAAVRRDHQHLIPFFPELQDRLLQDVFVALEVCREQDAPIATEQTAFEARFEHGGTLRDLLLPDPAPRSPGRLVVLGEPGAGKSTLARNLAHALASANTAAAPVPIYVALSRLQDAPFDPCRMAAEAAGAAQPDQIAGLTEWLAVQAAAGRAVFLLDGLDEVEPRCIDGVANAILTLASPSPIAVLTRPIAVEGRELGRRFTRVRVQPLDAARRRRMVEQLLEPEDAARFMDELARSEGLADLCRNPLLLTMAAMVARQAMVEREPLPSRRGRLYDRAIHLLLHRGYGTAPTPVKEPGAARRLLAALSLELHEGGGESWSREQLDQMVWEVRQAAAPLNFQLKESWVTNEAFLEDIGLNAGVLGPHEGKHVAWRYLHRSLREYLAAEQVAGLGDETLQQRIAAWQREVEAAKAEPKGSQAAARPDPERWGEVYALVCGMVADPLQVLRTIREASAELALRALAGVEHLPHEAGLSFALETEGWDAELLFRLVRNWQVPAATIERVLGPRIKPAASVDELGQYWWLLEQVGAKPERTKFFEDCQRPVAGAPRLGAVAVPAGTFLMGSPATEAQRSESEGPQHRVDVAAFWLCREAVTSADYACFDPKNVKSEHPAVQVSWWEAYLYCRWLGDDVRLPSEAEWEYACRAGTATPFWFGATITPEEVNYDGNYPYGSGKKGEYRSRTVPVGSLPANGWGLHEMHGNVWEWCQDRWHDSYEGARLDGTAWEEGGSGYRVLRGGSWFGFAWYCRSASRFWGLPGLRLDFVGFRPASSSPDFFTTSPLGRASKLRPTNPS